MTGVVIAVCALLAAVAAAGVLRPFGRRIEAPHPLTDPVEDERRSVLRALRDLERDRMSGGIEEEEYAALRAETEARAVSTLRSLDVPSTAVASAVRARSQDHRPWSGNGDGTPSRTRGIAPTIVVSGLVVAAVVSVLLSTARTRAPGQPFSGGIPSTGAASAADTVSFFEQRVRQHPNDLAARLDLAERYLQSGRIRPAIDQYLAALQIDPQNTEARATLGFVVYRAGRANEGLRIVDQALARDPSFPEALFYRGVILLRGLERPAAAAEAFRRYLRTAPFGARRAEAQDLLAEAKGTRASR